MKGIVRRTIGLAVGLAPVVLLLFSLVIGLTGKGGNPMEGIWFMVVALVVALHNFYLSFLSPKARFRRVGSMEDYRHVSGNPLVGTVLVVVGALYGFGASVTAGIGLAAMALDTGGSMWFLIATWHDSSLWDK